VGTTAICWGYGLGAVSYPFWWWAVRPDNVDSEGRVHHSALQFGDVFLRHLGMAMLVGLVGLLLLAMAPHALHTVLRLDGS